MLTGITLKDYTTFIKKTHFDFKATNYKIREETNVGAERILKGALFVGENASGKTQVLESILLLLTILVGNAEVSFVIKKSMYTKGDKFNLKYDFDVKGVPITYEIGFKFNEIYEEKLFVDKILKLERLGKTGKTYFNEQKVVEDINPSLSFLKLEYYSSRFNNDSILNAWFEFLKNSLFINCVSGKSISLNPNKLVEQSIEKFAETNDVSILNEVVDSVGYNCEFVLFDKKSSNKDGSLLMGTEEVTIGVKKKGMDFVIPLQFESRGNRSFAKILLPIIYATKNDCMLIVDEFSSGLHNELEEALIRLFFDESGNSQLFFTSHSTNLLDSFILRPDQIYSFRFITNEGTCINRFSDENPRESQNMEKMYLNGVFNGMPKYNKEFKNK